ILRRPRPRRPCRWRKTFRRILDQQGLGMVVPPATATRLEAIMANLRDVEEWRASLTENQRFRWASPSAVFKQCPVFAKDRAAARPVMTPRPVGFEIAIDAINERWEKADADERAVIRERLASMTLEPEPKDIEEVFEALTWLILDADQCREILGRLAGE